ncbi:hypothetical protein BC937DRAFT_87410, partial [Endogone sp. FLAS-F59071]
TQFAELEYQIHPLAEFANIRNISAATCPPAAYRQQQEATAIPLIMDGETLTTATTLMGNGACNKTWQTGILCIQQWHWRRVCD